MNEQHEINVIGLTDDFHRLMKPLRGHFCIIMAMLMPLYTVFLHFRIYFLVKCWELKRG